MLKWVHGHLQRSVEQLWVVHGEFSVRVSVLGDFPDPSTRRNELSRGAHCPGWNNYQLLNRNYRRRRGLRLRRAARSPDAVYGRGALGERGDLARGRALEARPRLRRESRGEPHRTRRGRGARKRSRPARLEAVVSLTRKRGLAAVRPLAGAIPCAPPGTVNVEWNGCGRGPA